MATTEHPTYIWWNGEQVRWEDATIHVTEIAWSTVGAVFEGIRAYWNEEAEELYIFRLQEHLERLKDSMRLVRLASRYSVEDLRDSILSLLKANDIREDTYIRPLAYSTGTSGKRLSDVSPEAALLINTNPMPGKLLSGETIRVKVSSWTRITDNVMPPRVKNISNYRNGQLASMEATADGYDSAIMLGPHGKVSEAPSSCVIMIKGGQLITPPVTDGILESVTRDAIMTMARESLQIDVVERSIDRTELYLADEVFLCGTAYEITPVVEIDRYDIGSGGIGEATGALQTLFDRVLRGTEPDYGRWRTASGVATGVAAD